MIDTYLIERARGGDEDALSELILNYTPYVYRTAYAFLHDSMEAEDVVQEVFIKVYRSLPQLSEARAFHSWLSKIITHQCLDWAKKKQATPIADVSLESLASPAHSNYDRRLIIKEALSNLSEEHRTVLVLREWQGYDYHEISLILGIPLGTVKSRISSARMQMRKLLSDQKLAHEEG